MLELKTHDKFFEFSHNSVHKLLVPNIFNFKKGRKYVKKN
ncbi:hypothetical protein ATCC51561_2011 [Campylobacter concisus ATCC 51561]|nr:hypothetical protein ATCC51561_2011 [Campylobacter concisus ATCC 51561]